MLKKYFFNIFYAAMKLFLSIVYIRIISLRCKFNDHPLVEYPQLEMTVAYYLDLSWVYVG